MADTVKWQLPDLAVGNDTQGIHLTLASRRPVLHREYIVCVEGIPSDVFTTRNPGWHHSAKANAPFRYVPACEVANSLIELGLISFSSDCAPNAVIVYTWQTGADDASDMFDLLLSTPVDDSGLVKTDYLEGRSNGE